MLYTITAASPEVEDFVLELQIESNATFADLHRLIRQSCEWDDFKPATFYICDHRWRHERAIPEKSFEDDTMSEVELGDLLEDEGQRLQYLFDPDERRHLLMEVSHIAFSKHIDGPLCRRKHGQPPLLQLEKVEAPQPLTNAELLAQLNAAALADDEDDDIEPTDDDLFEIEELDVEGFDFTEG